MPRLDNIRKKGLIPERRHDAFLLSLLLALVLNLTFFIAQALLPKIAYLLQMFGPEAQVTAMQEEEEGRPFVMVDPATLNEEVDPEAPHEAESLVNIEAKQNADAPDIPVNHVPYIPDGVEESFSANPGKPGPDYSTQENPPGPADAPPSPHDRQVESDNPEENDSQEAVEPSDPAEAAEAAEIAEPVEPPEAAVEAVPEPVPEPAWTPPAPAEPLSLRPPPPPEPIPEAVPEPLPEPVSHPEPAPEPSPPPPAPEAVQPTEPEPTPEPPPLAEMVDLALLPTADEGVFDPFKENLRERERKAEPTPTPDYQQFEKILQERRQEQERQERELQAALQQEQERREMEFRQQQLHEQQLREQQLREQQQREYERQLQERRQYEEYQRQQQERYQEQLREQERQQQLEHLRQQQEIQRQQEMQRQQELQRQQEMQRQQELQQQQEMQRQRQYEEQQRQYEQQQRQADIQRRQQEAREQAERQAQAQQEARPAREGRPQPTFKQIGGGAPTRTGGSPQRRNTASKAVDMFADPTMRYLQSKWPQYMNGLARKLQDSLNRTMILYPSYYATGQARINFRIAPDGSLESQQTLYPIDGSDDTLRLISEQTVNDAFPYEPPPREMLADPLFKKMSVIVNIY